MLPHSSLCFMTRVRVGESWGASSLTARSLSDWLTCSQIPERERCASVQGSRTCREGGGVKQRRTAEVQHHHYSSSYRCGILDSTCTPNVRGTAGHLQTLGLSTVLLANQQHHLLPSNPPPPASRKKHGFQVHHHNSWSVQTKYARVSRTGAETPPIAKASAFAHVSRDDFQACLLQLSRATNLCSVVVRPPHQLR